MDWFWIFFFYSLAGYGLEKVYAFVTRSRHQVRKCFLLLPLCPVYGLAMAAVLALAGDTEDFWQLALYGGILCTAVEYVVHFLYEKCLGVLFWDYSNTHLDLNRRVCFPLTAILLLTVDGFFSARLLRRSRNIDLLGIRNLWRELHQM